jgi:hypothetical protein
MTDHEMRIRIAEAMEWTEIEEDGYGDLVGMPPDDNCREPLPNPLESDADAARLRAWVVDQPWCTSLIVSSDCLDVEVTIYGADGEPIDDTPITVTRVGEPDPCRRERLALCRAVVQALDASEAGGVP